MLKLQRARLVQEDGGIFQRLLTSLLHKDHTHIPHEHQVPAESSNAHFCTHISLGSNTFLQHAKYLSPHGKCQAKDTPRAQALPQGMWPLTGYAPYVMRHRLVFSLKRTPKGKRDSASSVTATAEAPCKDSYQMALHVLRCLFTRESWHYSPLGKL